MFVTLTWPQGLVTETDQTLILNDKVVVLKPNQTCYEFQADAMTSMTVQIGRLKRHFTVGEQIKQPKHFSVTCLVRKPKVVTPVPVTPVPVTPVTVTPVTVTPEPVVPVTPEPVVPEPVVPVTRATNVDSN